MTDLERVEEFIENELEQRGASLLPACGPSDYITEAEETLAAVQRVRRGLTLARAEAQEFPPDEAAACRLMLLLFNTSAPVTTEERKPE